MAYLRRTIKIVCIAFAIPASILVYEYAPHNFGSEFWLLLSALGIFAIIAGALFPWLFAKHIDPNRPKSKITICWNKKQLGQTTSEEDREAASID
jgi:hypothetical protein